MGNLLTQANYDKPHICSQRILYVMGKYDNIIIIQLIAFLPLSVYISPPPVPASKCVSPVAGHDSLHEPPLALSLLESSDGTIGKQLNN